MKSEIPLLSSFVRKDLFQDIFNLDIRDKAKRKESLKQSFTQTLKKRWFTASLLTIFTFGVYPYKLFKCLEKRLSSLIAARKIYYYDQLIEQIETIRASITFKEPKSAIHHIYQTLIQDCDFPYNRVYSKSDLLLCITTPIEPTEYELAVKEIRESREYQRIWRNLKQASRHHEIAFIKGINSHYSLLKNRYLLPKEEIHLRLARTSCVTASSDLTTLRCLSQAFHEITTAFELLVTLKKTQFETFEVLSSILNLSAIEAKEIHDALLMKKGISELPDNMLKYLLSLIIKKEQILNLCESDEHPCLFLTLNEQQLSVILELKSQLSRPNTFTSSLLQCLCSNLKPCDNFTAKLSEQTPDQAHLLLKESNQTPHFEVVMTQNFLDEMNTTWEPMHLANQDESITFDAESNISFRHLRKVNRILAEIAGDDRELLILLQEALSKKGKKIISESIKDSIRDVLGEEKICQDLNLSNIKVHKLNPDYLEIEYTFDSPEIPRGTFNPSIIQPIKRFDGRWKSA